MATKQNVRFDDSRYERKYERKVAIPPDDSSSIIKYISPRVINRTVPEKYLGGIRGTGWLNVGSNFQTTASAMQGTDIGLSSLVPSSTFTTISAIHSIDNDRIIDEYRELSRLTEILRNTILDCYNLQTDNRAKELQLDWLRTNNRGNAASIEKMYLTEMENAKRIINDNLQQNSFTKKKIGESDKAIPSCEDQYQKLLARRNRYSKEVFDIERKIIQNNAEAQFLQRQITNIENEVKFYLLKNQNLDARRARLRYELDEEIFSLQALKMEISVLENEKITKEDIRATSIDNARNSIDITQIAGMQPSKYFYDQLQYEVQRIRDELEKTIQVYREESHRKYELELHRYEMSKISSAPTITNEFRIQFEKQRQEKKLVQQQIINEREKIDVICFQIEEITKQIQKDKTDKRFYSNSRHQLLLLNQGIEEREHQLQEALRARQSLKQQIEYNKERLNRYSIETKSTYEEKRTSVQSIDRPTKLITSFVEQTPIKQSSIETFRTSYSSTPTLVSPSRKSSGFVQVEENFEDGTLIRYGDFNIDQDCKQLYDLLTSHHINESTIVHILCNRSNSQRIQLREKYRTLYRRNLHDDLDRITGNSLNKLLKLLILSLIERDCFEIQKALNESYLNENVFAEILFARSRNHIQALRNAYHNSFGNTIEANLSKRDDELRRLLIDLFQANREDDERINEENILKDARDLSNSGIESKLTSGSTFARLLCTRSNAQLKRIFAAYQQFSSMDIEQTIQVYTTGPTYHLLMAIVRLIRNRPRYFAYQLKKSLKGTLTNENDLNRIVVSRCEVDMVQIKIEYERIVQRTLYDHIQTDTLGNYKRALLELIRQRMDAHGMEVKFKTVYEPEEVTKNPNSERQSIQWRTSVEKIRTDRSNNRPLYRSTSDHFSQDRRYLEGNQRIHSTIGDNRYDKRNQSEITLTTNTSPRKSRYPE